MATSLEAHLEHKACEEQRGFVFSLSQQKLRVLSLHALVHNFCVLSSFDGEVRGVCALSATSTGQFNLKGERARAG